MKKAIVYLLITLISVMGVSAVDYYGVWQDSNGDGARDHLVGYILPYDLGTDAVTAYNYFSWSAHPNAPEPEAYKSKIYLYDDRGLSLNMFHNVDKGGSKKWNDVDWNIRVKGIASSVIFSDDRSELTFNPSKNRFEGRWHYRLNTDGGIVELDKNVDDEFVAKIIPKEWGDIKSFWVYSADAEQAFELDMKSPVWITNKKVPEDVPEFTTIGAGLALLGAGFVAYKKRRQ